MTWMVAPSYQKGKIAKVDEDAKKALVVETCDRCSGTGTYIIPPIFSGTCYKCGGAGQIGRWVRAYTEDEYERYIATRERAAERRAEKKEAELRERLNNSEVNKKAMLKEMGYDVENPMVYVVFGGNTYAIKDELKAAGARFERALGWYFSHPVEVPVGYGLVVIEFDKVFNWEPAYKKIYLREEAATIAAAALDAARPASASEYIGEVGDRLRGMEVTLIDARSFDGQYGTSNVYTFKQGDDVFVWWTSSCKEVQVGEKLFLTGTVKEHKEYRGVKQTVLSRCIIKKGE